MHIRTGIHQRAIRRGCHFRNERQQLLAIQQLLRHRLRPGRGHTADGRIRLQHDFTGRTTIEAQENTIKLWHGGVRGASMAVQGH